MEYLEVKIFTTTYGIDAVTGALSDLGIDAFIIEDAHDFEVFLSEKKSYDWDYVDESLMELMEIETCIIVYLDVSPQGAVVYEKIKNIMTGLKCADSEGILGRLLVEQINVSDDQWKDNWKAYFKPARITDRIIIKPTWEQYEKTREDELVINIDPGMAFGTGTHETTAMCIRLLEKHIDPGKDDVLDVGCGSGILAIAASMLGAKSSTGIDIDPIAVNVSYENIVLNGLSEQISVFEGDLTKELDMMADIVVANLVAELVITLAGEIRKHLKTKKILIASGILIEKQEMVAEGLRGYGFEILEILNEGDWAAICAAYRSDGFANKAESCDFQS